jgi:Holliday junction resolvase RusA-like endonuclease
MDEFSFIHLEDPVVKGRPRFSKWGAYTPKKTLDAEKRIRDSAIEAGIPKFDVPVEMSLVFYTKTKRRSDASNLAKLVEDALNTVAYSDDYLIESLHVRVFRSIPGETPRSEVSIKEL